MKMRFLNIAAIALMAAVPSFVASSSSAFAQQAAPFELTLKDHKFSPAEIKAPAGKALSITLKNLDTTPAEFESKALRFEKVVKGGSEITVQIRALTPGRYKFVDEFNEAIAQGVLVIE